MSFFFRYLIAGWSFIALAGELSRSDAAAPGFLEGHLKIFPLSDVELADDGNATKTVTAEPYAEYPLIIFSQDGHKEIARVTADARGNYHVSLPPGDYVLDVQGRAPGHIRAKPQPFTVLSKQTVRVDTDLDTGVR